MAHLAFHSRPSRPRRRLAGATASIVLLASASLGAAALVGPTASASAANGNSNGKQTICHRTDSNTNPYVVNTPNKNGDVSGHAGHTGPVWNSTLKAQHVKWGDIIPPFSYNDHGTTKTFPGLNPNLAGRAIAANGCRIPPPPHLTLRLVKTNDANADGTFTDSETSTTPGAAVAFQVTVTNGSAVGVVIDTLADAVGSTSIPMSCASALLGTTLAAGASATCSFTASGYAPPDGTSKTNTATSTVHQAAGDGYIEDTHNTASASDSSTVATARPDLRIVKTGPTGDVHPGVAASYTLTASDTGTAPAAAGTVVVDDPLPAGTTRSSLTATGWTCTGSAVHCTLDGALAVGVSASLTLSLTLASDSTATTLTNTATVSPTDVTPEDNTSSVTNPVTPVPAADLKIVKTGPASVSPGDTITWTLTVSSTGTAASSDATVSDTLPADVTFSSASGSGWSCSGTSTVTCTETGSLAPAGSSAITLVGTLSSGFTGTSFSNTGTVGPTDSTPADNTSTVTTTVVQPAGGGGGTTGGGGGVTGSIGGGGAVQTPGHLIVVPPAAVTLGSGSPTTLPRTGAPLWGLLMATSLLLTAGGALLRLGRRVVTT